MRRLRLGSIAAALALAASVLVPAAAQANPASAPAVPLASLSSGKTDAAGNPLDHWATRGAAPLAASPLTTPAGSAAPDDPTMADCPPGLHCVIVPAAYRLNSADPSDYGNYDKANRPADGNKITGVVIHDTEGTLQSALAEFQNPLAYVSAHYVIDSDGTIYIVVSPHNIGWQAGNWYLNVHTVGIEHVGHAISGATDYTSAMYNSSATLVRWLSSNYGFSLDRQHVIGHDNVPGPTQISVAGMHWDPAAFWNWDRYMALMGAPIRPTAGPEAKLVTITPNWATNQPVVTSCDSTTHVCTTLPRQSANFVYLRQAPSETAPLLTDLAIHSDGSPGTTHIDDWSATADYGQTFAIADRQGPWLAIWYGGQKGWFRQFNLPGGFTVMGSSGQFITPRAGLTSIPVYGRAYPAASAYPADGSIPVQSVVPLNYTIAAGQSYSTTGAVGSDYGYYWTIDSRLPNDHTTVFGPASDRYYPIQFNHRLAYVKASDVQMIGAR
ncbi:MAG TPA: N-acetylmuramoyl-L-alanine amidase [Candidatus Saccharimonadia bacterium]|nr:N-acetylmuramoyl-L-alanine amidase [Candidatus Saccharimonadia bacterium]